MALITLNYRTKEAILSSHRKVYKGSAIFSIVLLLCFLYVLNDNSATFSVTVFLFTICSIVTYHNYRYSIDFNSIEDLYESQVADIECLSSIDEVREYLTNIKKEDRRLCKDDYFHLMEWNKKYQKIVKKNEYEQNIENRKMLLKNRISKLLTNQ